MFLMSEIEETLASAAFLQDHRSVVDGLAAARLQRTLDFDKEVDQRLAYLVQAVLVSAADWNSDDRIQVCRTAAEIAELLATRSTNDAAQAMRFRLRAALLYELAGMPAMSAGVVLTGTTPEAVRQFFSSSGRFGSLASDIEIQPEALPAADVANMALELVETDMNRLADYERGVRDEFLPRNALLLSSLASRVAIGLTATDFSALDAVMELHRLSSVRNNVPRDLFDELSRYEFPVALFPTQAKALQSGLLDDGVRSWGFAAPTGTGKTFLTRLLILDLLRERQDGMVLYLVPSRALVHEVSTSLAKFFSADGVAVTAVTPQLIALDQGESARLEASNVIVLTPEKADLLLRIGESVIARSALVIVDEAHHIESGTRGALLELYLMRLRQMIQPAPRIVMLSAVAPNIRELAEWAGENAAATTVSGRATRMRAGVFRVRREGRRNQGWIDYVGGTSLPLITERLESGVRRQLAQVADAVSAAGPVLIVAKGKGECETLADTLRQFQEDRGRLRVLTDSEAASDIMRRLDSRLSREMYADVPMRPLLKHRIAYHHAGLPPRVRIAVEDAIKSRMVDFVFATTTLAAGVNFPFSTVIVQSLALREAPEKGQSARYHPVTPRSFWNIAGRAGRPGVDREGQVVLFEPTLGLDKINAVIGPYLDPNLMSLNPVGSALGRAIAEIRDGIESGRVPREQLSQAVLGEGLPRAVQGAVNLVRIALVHAASIGVPSPEETVTRTLAFRQASIVERDFLREIFRDQQSVVTKFFEDPLAPAPNVVAELGVSIETLTQLRDYVRELEDWRFQALRSVMRGGNANLEQAKFVLGPVAKRMAELEGRTLGGIYGEVATLWLSGIPLTDVRRRSSLQGLEKLEDLITVIYSRVQFLLPWGLYAFDRIVEEDAKRRGSSYDNEIRLLAYLTDAGVPSFDALRLVDLEFERVDATRLAARYQQSRERQELDIVGWLRIQPREALHRIVRGAENRDVDFDLDRLLRNLA